jgi:hypothetical protein
MNRFAATQHWPVLFILPQTTHLTVFSRWHPRAARNLIATEVFGRYVVLRDVSRVNFSHVWVGCIFNAADHFGLGRIAPPRLVS